MFVRIVRSSYSNCTVCFICSVLLQSRELAIVIVWKDQRQICALKFLRLEDFLYEHRRDRPINLEPQGVLFAEVCVCALEQMVLRSFHIL